MNKIYKPFIRLFGLFGLMLWAATFGVVGAILWIVVLIVCGPKTSDKFFDFWAKTGMIFDDMIIYE